MQQKVKLEVWGGAGEHGRSCYFVQAGNTAVLLDCGGKKQAGGLYPRIVPQQVQSLQAVFLSHAHEDHMAALPLLLRFGYQGEIWLTRETYRQLPKYASAWRNYTEKQGKKLPYPYEDWQQLRYRFLDDEAEQGCWQQLLPELRVCWGASGHLPGAVWFLLELAGQLIFYSGDYSSESTVLQATLPAPELFAGRRIELAIIDAAYGVSEDSQQALLNRLLQQIKQVYGRGGHVLLPVPISGRGLDLLLEIRARFPQLPIAAEASLIQEWQNIIRSQAMQIWLHRDAIARITQALSNVLPINGQDERQRLIEGKPHIILSPDGMMLAEPARSYGQLLGKHARHAVLFTGHVSGDAELPARLACEVASYRYKVHQGLPDVQRMLHQLQPQRALLVHAEMEATKQLIEQLMVLGYIRDISLAQLNEHAGRLIELSQYHSNYPKLESFNNEII